MTTELTKEQAEAKRREDLKKLQEKFQGFKAELDLLLRKWGVNQKPILKATEEGVIPAIRIYPCEWPKEIIVDHEKQKSQKKEKK